MKMMKAIVKKSDTDTTFSMEKVPVPIIQQDEYLIRICAIGVGIHDGYFLPTSMYYPYTIGIEAAGIIEKVGQRTTEFSIGDRVAFVSMMQPKGGTWAEYAAVSKDSLILKMPDDMPFTSAAAIPVAGNTVLKAFQALTLQHGGSLFIAGASGAIGTFAIQLAKQKRVNVASSASLKNHSYMRSLGADLTVDYHDPTWPDKVLKWQPSGVDASLAIQPNTGITSMEVVKDGGEIVAISGDQFQTVRHISLRPFPYQANVKKELTTMMEQIVKNDIQLTIEQVFPFDQALDALQKTATRHAQGKVVISLDLKK